MAFPQFSLFLCFCVAVGVGHVLCTDVRCMQWQRHPCARWTEQKVCSSRPSLPEVHEDK